MAQKAYKGFDKNLKCRGFQYEVGKEYKTNKKVVCCENGFHACTNPFDVLNYYNDFIGNRFCVVEQDGELQNDRDKTASSKIKIVAEIGISGLFKAGIEWLKEITSPAKIIEETKNNEGSSGDYAKIGSSGDSAKIGSSGDYAKIGSSGDYAKIGSSGDYAQIGSSGYSAKIGSSGYSAQIGSSGDSAQIGSSGDYAKIGSSGEDSVICCAGCNSIVKAKKGSWITLSEWKFNEEKGRFTPVCVKTEFVDGERIKEDTWYKLINGEFTDIQE